MRAAAVTPARIVGSARKWSLTAGRDRRRGAVRRRRRGPASTGWRERARRRREASRRETAYLRALDAQHEMPPNCRVDDALLSGLFGRSALTLSEARPNDASAISTLHTASFRRGWGEDEVVGC